MDDDNDAVEGDDNEENEEDEDECDIYTPES